MSNIARFPPALTARRLARREAFELRARIARGLRLILVAMVITAIAAALPRGAGGPPIGVEGRPTLPQLGEISPGENVSRAPAVITESFKVYMPPAFAGGRLLPRQVAVAVDPPAALVRVDRALVDRVQRSARPVRGTRSSQFLYPPDICRGRGRTWTAKSSGWRSWRCNRRL